MAHNIYHMIQFAVLLMRGSPAGIGCISEKQICAL
jgi:hypothetical protein